MFSFDAGDGVFPVLLVFGGVVFFFGFELSDAFALFDEEFGGPLLGVNFCFEFIDDLAEHGDFIASAFVEVFAVELGEEVVFGLVEAFLELFDLEL